MPAQQQRGIVQGGAALHGGVDGARTPAGPPTGEITETHGVMTSRIYRGGGGNMYEQISS